MGFRQKDELSFVESVACEAFSYGEVRQTRSLRRVRSFRGRVLDVQTGDQARQVVLNLWERCQVSKQGS